MSGIKTALLISGNGTTAEAVIKACQDRRLKNIDPFVISSKSDVPGIERAKKLNIATYVVDKKLFKSLEEFGEELLKVLENLRTELILLCGWIPLIPGNIILRYKNRIINQHPGPLDPGRADFGGKGLSTPYRVTCARVGYVWLTGEDPWTEATTQFVEEKFDKGEVIKALKVDLPIDKRQISFARLFQNQDELMETTKKCVEYLYPHEYQNVVDTLKDFSFGIVKNFKRAKPLIPSKNIYLLEQAKDLAIKLYPVFNLPK
ncbi:hypothetical protein HYS91_03880 [Candidatus Daviesbacteria bacterium]|nr:hypothetical protein [Candidatus Daviesbacteria bacterium]